MKATAMIVRIRMPTHIIAERQPGFSSVGLRLPSNAALCPCELGGGTRIVTALVASLTALVASRIKHVHTSPSLYLTQHRLTWNEISNIYYSYYGTNLHQILLNIVRFILLYFCITAVIVLTL